MPFLCRTVGKSDRGLIFILYSQKLPCRVRIEILLTIFCLSSKLCVLLNDLLASFNAISFYITASSVLWNIRGGTNIRVISKSSTYLEPLFTQFSFKRIQNYLNVI